MRMTKTGAAWLLAAALAVTLGVQVLDFFGKSSQVETQLASAINGYNNTTPERFRADLLSELERFDVRVAADDIEIVEDRAQDRVTVAVHFRATLRLLVVPLERELVVERSTGLLS